MPESKNLTKSRAGLAGARARWGDQRVLRLDQLDSDSRRLIQALLSAKKNAEREKVADDAT